jgi:hypothetical protein
VDVRGKWKWGCDSFSVFSECEHQHNDLDGRMQERDANFRQSSLHIIISVFVVVGMM